MRLTVPLKQLQRTGFAIFAALLLGSALASSPSVSANSCILLAINRLQDSLPSQALQDSAVELEMALTDEVLALLTTTDGTVGGLLKRGEKLPPWFVTEANQNFKKVKNPKKLAWDQLDAEKKHQLLKSISRARAQDFLEDRVIHGLVVRKAANLTFSKPTVFMGKRYEPGTYLIDLSSLLLPRVEYMGKSAVTTMGGIELHARNASGAGKVSRDARIMQEAAGIPPLNQHVHIVAPHTVGVIPGDPVLEAAIKGDYVRRSNLVVEMIGIVEEGVSVQTLENAEQVFYSSFGYTDVEGSTRYFLDVALGKSPKIGDRFKIGAVGMHGSDKYDGPVKLWGLQIRSIDYDTPPELAENLLDSIQHGMLTGEYGIPLAQMNRWLKRGESVSSQVADAWYNRDWGRIYSRSPREILSKVGGKGNRAARHFLEEVAETHQEVKMLLFSWGSDPLIFGNETFEKEILLQQVRALDRLLAGQAPINEIMRDFLLESGLYEAQLAAMGMKRAP